MKKIVLILFLPLMIFTTHQVNAQNMKMKITINSKEFIATLNDSEAVKELVKLLPMEVTMNEHKSKV